MITFDPAYDTGHPLTFTKYHPGRWTYSKHLGVRRRPGFLDKRIMWTDNNGVAHCVRWQVRYPYDRAR